MQQKGSGDFRCGGGFERSRLHGGDQFISGNTSRMNHPAHCRKRRLEMGKQGRHLVPIADINLGQQNLDASRFKFGNRAEYPLGSFW